MSLIYVGDGPGDVHYRLEQRKEFRERDVFTLCKHEFDEFDV